MQFKLKLLNLRTLKEVAAREDVREEGREEEALRALSSSRPSAPAPSARQRAGGATFCPEASLRVPAPCRALTECQSKASGRHRTPQVRAARPASWPSQPHELLFVSFL